jgi:hypothetical protein
MSAGSRPVSVLAVMAHPDDGELWAGGTLALHIVPEHRPRQRPRTRDHHRLHEHRLLLELRHGQGR